MTEYEESWAGPVAQPMSEYEKFLAARLQLNHEQGGSATTIPEIEWETDSSGTVLFRTVVLSPRPQGKRPLKSPRGED
jgi:hypothetical protein